MFTTNIPNFEEKKGVIYDADGTLFKSINVKKSLFLAGNLLRAKLGLLPYKQDADKVLLALKQRGIQLGLATDMSDGMLQWFRDSKILTPSLDSTFETIVNGSMVQNKKPDPEALYVAMDKMKLHPQECIAIGDSLKDIIPAVSIPRLTTCVIYDRSSEKDLKELTKLTPYHFNNWGEVLNGLN